ncbi:MAG: response regulator [Verrucomicrobia subdivision 3 bacterium]|nr:response regulator [Verrucomicrobiota bacterium]MCC6821859.1 response regulator [Limisphaerales bacterium]
MKKILLVDDDAVVRLLYQRKLEQGGFEVALAEDGLQAIQLLGAHTPDLVLLDLMMPKLSGDNVLRFIRTHPKLAKLPVVVLTNAFMSDQARTVSALGVARAIVKADCTPDKMLEIAGQLLNLNSRSPEIPPAPAAPLAPTDVPDPAREQFLANSVSVVGDLRELCLEFKSSPESAARSGNLAELYSQTHHLTGAAGLAGCHHLALMGGAVEALLFELVEKPQFINPSTARTVVSSLDYLALLFEDARSVRRAETLTGEVLIVDDDALVNRMALAALSRAKLSAQASENPLAALDLLAKTRFDLFLLDIEMPQLNGYELCRKIRCLPGYEKTPVIYITAHGDFESRAKSILAGGNDLIAKPIFPIELAVKAVTHLIRGRFAASAPIPL